MKILYVDTGVTGHHLTYALCLLQSGQNDGVVCFPEKVPGLSCRQIVLPADGADSIRTPGGYLRWFLRLRKICREERPDLVHFLYGDSFYRFFGLGLPLIGAKRKVVTIHWAREGFAHHLSLKCIARQCSQLVVHSGYIKARLKQLGIENVTHVEYPQFNTITKPKDEALAYYSLKKGVPVILCLGGTRSDKGLDILLSALEDVEKPFQLLIAGKAEFFDKAFIDSHSQSYADCVKAHLTFLSDDELALAISAADIIALPYRRVFSGASGPLGEGVAQNKCIVGPSHGNLNDTITKNHLGYTFETENSGSLARVLDEALARPFVPDETYLAYRESLDPKYFAQKYAALYQALRA